MEQGETNLKEQLARVIADIGVHKLLVQQHYRTRDLDAMRQATQVVVELEMQRRRLRGIIGTRGVDDPE